MTVVLLICVGILAVAALLLVVRISLGPTMLDRVVALDVLVAVMICGLALEAAVNRHTTTLPILRRALPARFRRLGQHRAVHPRQRRRRGGAVMSWTDVADVVAAACSAARRAADADRRDRHPAASPTCSAGCTRPPSRRCSACCWSWSGSGSGCATRARSGCSRWSRLFQLVTTPIASHMVGRASFRAGQVREDLLVVDELSDVLPGDERGPCHRKRCRMVVGHVELERVQGRPRGVHRGGCLVRKAHPRGAVVVGYNGKDHSRAALAWGAQEAARRDAPLLVLFAANYPGMTVEPGPGLFHREPGALEAAEEVTARGVAEAARGPPAPAGRRRHRGDEPHPGASSRQATGPRWSSWAAAATAGSSGRCSAPSRSPSRRGPGAR